MQEVGHQPGHAFLQRKSQEENLQQHSMALTTSTVNLKDSIIL